MKILLVIVAVLIAGFIVVASRGCDGADADPSSQSETVEVNLPRVSSNGPAFHVGVGIHRINQPLFGLLEDAGLRLKNDPEFDAMSPGASAGWVAPRQLELRADGWDLKMVVGAGGEIDPATRLVYPIEQGGPLIRCRPADPAVGNFRLTAPPEARTVGGEFMVKLSRCENAASGKPIEYPGRPLTVVGRFEDVPRL